MGEKASFQMEVPFWGNGLTGNRHTKQGTLHTIQLFIGFLDSLLEGVIVKNLYHLDVIFDCLHLFRFHHVVNYITTWLGSKDQFTTCPENSLISIH
jgi:hypothetical protein